jgi:hypothetical protein
MDNPDTWALVSEQRAELFKRVMPMALENLSIAQHRDTLRYATIRGGGVIDHRCGGFNLGTTCICNKQLQLP